MEQEQLKKLTAWFDDYVAGFYGDDDFINVNLKLKEQHSRRSCEEMLYLDQEVGLSANQKRIAEVIALFHDIGRFRQFVEYNTYNDVRSVNHCLLGMEVLRETNVLDGIDQREKDLIEKAIEYHGSKELPNDLDGEHLLFSKLIRDADKLDIFYVVTEYYAQCRDNPQEFMLELEFPDVPECSSKIVEAILAGQRVDYSCLKTLNDMRLLQLAWVYDVNFTATLRRIRQRKFLEKIIEFLPKSNEISNIKKAILQYVDNRIGGDSRKERQQI